MIKKDIIREDGYNQAVILSIYDNGDFVVTLNMVERKTDAEGNETEYVLESDSNIVYPAGSFELTEEELNELNGNANAVENTTL